MKTKSKLAAGCSKHCFEVVDKTDEVSSKHVFEFVDKTAEVSYLYLWYLRQGEADVVWRDFRRVLVFSKARIFQTLNTGIDNRADN